MGTVTPNFETYLVSTDGESWQPSPATFAWSLASGRNRLRMRVRNTSGIVGPVSGLDLDYAPDRP